MTPLTLRAALSQLIEALKGYDPKLDAFPEKALSDAVAALAAAPQIEPPDCYETDAEQYAWQAGWEARDDAMWQEAIARAEAIVSARVAETCTSIPKDIP